jgi:predicted nucleic acid-binding protein
MTEPVFVDTNLFVRYITNDLPEQADAVERLIQRAGAGEIRLITNSLAICEIVWTMESFYEGITVRVPAEDEVQRTDRASEKLPSRSPCRCHSDRSAKLGLTRRLAPRRATATKSPHMQGRVRLGENPSRDFRETPFALALPLSF